MDSKSKQLIGYYQNVRGLRTKSHDFLLGVAASDYDFICITESWLTSDFYDREYFDGRYVVFRCDRSQVDTGAQRGGGVMIAVRTELKPLRREWPIPPRASSDCVWLSIPLLVKGDKYLHIACVYIPHGPGYRDALEVFFDVTSGIINDHPNDIFLITGDFNVSNAVWQKSYTLDQTLVKGGDFAVGILGDFLSFTGLRQFNGIPNINHRILDLVMSNIDCKTLHCVNTLTEEDAHHKSIELRINFNQYSTLKSAPAYNYNFWKADFESINGELFNINWHALFDKLTIEECVSKFYFILNSLVRRFVPRKLIRSSQSHPLWHTKPLRKLLSEKRKFHKLWKLYNNPLDYESFKVLRKRAKCMEIESHRNYIVYAENKIKYFPKYFWTYVKTIKANSGLPGQMSFDGHKTSDCSRICELFNNYFHSVFAQPKSDHVPTETLEHSNNSIVNISSIEITEVLVRKYLKTINVNKSAGPDGIHPLLIRHCADRLTTPVTFIFNLSFGSGCVPEIWKRAFVTPIPKGPVSQNVENYRPISKLCHLGKIQEKIVTDQLLSVVQRAITRNQHGFCRQRGVNSNLLTFTELILEAMDSGFQVDVVYTDFAKAFDKICHNTLLLKLWRLGIHGDLFRWIKSYIGNRSQAVVLSGHCSEYKIIPSGVPQGSHLGPLLFVLYVNDITESIEHSRVLLYADDTKIFRIIRNEEDVHLLQQDIRSFEGYCAQNNLFLNPDKCFSITYTRKKNPKVHTYTLCGKNLNRVMEIRDLGVIMDSELTFIPHINKIVSRSFKLLGFILRIGKPFKNPFTYKLLYNSYVRSRLEFASSVWNPYQNVHQNKIERIQHKFIKTLDYRMHHDHVHYESSLGVYNIVPLQQRRSLIDLTYLYKILHNIVDAPLLLEDILFRVPRNNERASRKKDLFVVKFSKTCYGSNSFIKRTCSLYNAKCSETDIFDTSLREFKSHISKLNI